MSDTASALSSVLHAAPLEVQLEAAEHLRGGRSLLVRLPTGSGKTLLAGAPHAAGLLAPSQMIFMTPLRTLTSAQAATLRDEIDADASCDTTGLPWEVREQSGAVPDDPEFVARTVVCTFDQALSAALHIPYSVSPRRRNLNAGAIAAAYLVADELHLYPRDEALATLLWLLRNRPPLPFCLMTATMTDATLTGLAELLGAQPLSDLPPKDKEQLGVTEQRRTVTWKETPLSPEGIAELAAPRSRTLVVVNTVNRAIDLGRELRRLLPGHDVFVLHSRFYREDRDRITESVLRALGKGQVRGRPVVVVATQVVEVGLDISAELLLSELAPAATLVQRWGRCARWGGEGTVVVAPPADPGYPYVSEPGGKELTERTRTWLAAEAAGPGGLAMDAAAEQALLEAGHAEADRTWLDAVHVSLKETAIHIGRTVREGSYADAGHLIRNVEQRTVLVHGRPAELDQPFAFEGFGLRHGTLQGLARHLGLGGSADSPQDDDLISFDVPSPPTWTLQVPIWKTTGESSAARKDQLEGWRIVRDSRELEAAPVVALHPALVHYDPDLGLSLTPGDRETPKANWARPRRGAERPARGRFSYQRETLEQHVARALDVIETRAVLWPRLAPLAPIIEAWLGWPAGLLRRILTAAVVMHDVGKLTPAWQAGIREVQKRRNRPWEPWLAHSDSEGDEDSNGPPARMPPHALSGAAHALDLARWLDAQVNPPRSAGRSKPSPGAVLFTAIATHHSPSVRTTALGKEELLDRAARHEASRLLQLHGFPGEVAQIEEGEQLGDQLVRTDDLNRPLQARELVALSLVIRLLRFADGWSQEWHTVPSTS